MVKMEMGVEMGRFRVLALQRRQTWPRRGPLEAPGGERDARVDRRPRRRKVEARARLDRPGVDCFGSGRAPWGCRLP